MAYGIAHKKQQARLRRDVHLKNLLNFPEHTTDEQKREILVAHVKALVEHHRTLTPKSVERKMVGGQIERINQEINKLRPAIKADRTLANYFVDIAKSRLTAAEFNIWMREAVDLWQKERERIK